jgi:UDP-N-acetylglucosamine:LPS N-acetylglucosamine transferase
MGELPAVALPAILVPCPYAGGHQKLNALPPEERRRRYLDDGDLHGMLHWSASFCDEARFAPCDAARRLARPDAARRIARMLLDLAENAA